LAFAAGSFDNFILSFIAGCCGTLALVLLRFSTFSIRESRDRINQANDILAELGINKMVDVTVDSTVKNLVSIEPNENGNENGNENENENDNDSDKEL